MQDENTTKTKNEYKPDKWVILKITNPEGDSHYKVMGSWSGGYLNGDSWRLSSGLEKIDEDGDTYLMYNYSGSTYICHKDAEGVTGWTGGILFGFMQEAEDSGAKIETITVGEFLSEQA